MKTLQLYKGEVTMIMIKSLLLVLSIVGVVALMVVAALTSGEEKERNKENLGKIIEENGLDKLKGTVFRASNNSCFALLDELSKKFHLIYSTETRNKGIYNYQYFSCDFEDIIESEVIIDNHVITKTSRLSQAGSMLVGT